MLLWERGYVLYSCFVTMVSTGLHRNVDWTAAIWFHLYSLLRPLCIVVKSLISPGFPLAVNQKVVKQEENALLDISRRDFEEVSIKQWFCANIRQVGSLSKQKERIGF